MQELVLSDGLQGAKQKVHIGGAESNSKIGFKGLRGNKITTAKKIEIQNLVILSLLSVIKVLVQSFLPHEN